MRAGQKHQVCRLLAEGELSQKDIAAKFGVDQSTISLIKTRNEDKIEEIRQSLDDEFAGIWVAKKTERLLEYTADIERLTEAIELVEPGDEDEILDLTRAMKVKHAALRNVAEELGHLPTRAQLEIEHKNARLEIVGVDPEDI